MYNYQNYGSAPVCESGAPRESVDRLHTVPPMTSTGESCRYTRGQDNCTPPCPSSKLGLDGYPLAMVYSPIQRWGDLYCESEGLARGTIFKQLDLPLEVAKNNGRGGVC